jgi:hypothetical protein
MESVGEAGRCRLRGKIKKRPPEGSLSLPEGENQAVSRQPVSARLSGRSIQQVFPMMKRQPSYTRRLTDAGISNETLRSIGRRHPGRSGELGRQTEGLAADVAIIGVRSSPQDDGSLTGDQRIGPSATHPKGDRPRLGKRSVGQQGREGDGQAQSFHCDHRISERPVPSNRTQD